MKVKVINSFRDKYTNVFHEKGKEIEVDKKRYEEINSTSFGILVRGMEEQQTIDFDSMTKKELVEYAAKEKGIDLEMSMTKKEMIEELV